ncbi:Protein NRT1/ PTR FAMILY 5.7 [Hibiscus syriacus]|uniref:Protein NRT1/ PTR FAMILY 5.7 n=1 Tax=Hibiscus syriacus TaxID=106335 RepID=A0A6A2XA54_HIBSY|nr:Protein NRT1/ PTR FAMILY 5.7 [Hibiscus syriacus]
MDERNGKEIRDIAVGEDEETWVYDSSVDHKGRLPLRASTGAWKASLFIITIEFSERLSYFGIATSLIIYLTKVIHQDLKTAARSVNYWAGVTTLMPLFGGFIADAYLGRFYTVLVSSIVYLLGLILLTMSWFVPSLKACDADVCTEPRKAHEVAFFLAIYLISIGTGGHKPSLESFGADQFDDDHPEERKKKLSFFNWWNSGLCLGLLLAVTVIVCVQDHVNWGIADIILTIVMASSLLIFVLGRPYYRYRKVSGSPLTPMLQVLVAAISKRKLPYPSNTAELYEVPKSRMAQGRLLCHTKKLKFLDRAAIIEDKGNSSEKQGPWRLATVNKVEEMKLVINMIPIWLTSLPFGMCVAQAATFFIKQGVIMDRKIANFVIPPASIYSLAAIGMIISVTIYEKVLVPVLRKAIGNERGITILQRIGFGMLFSITTMIVAALVEKKRLDVVKNEPVNGSLSMSVFWLAPQFLIIGAGDGFTLVGLQEYFYDQVPDSMRSLGIAFYLSVIGASNFLSSLLITLVDHVTEKGGESWFGKDLNSSRLDKFYWLLAILTMANLLIFVVVAKRYSYKNVQSLAVANCNEEEDAAGSMA